MYQCNMAREIQLNLPSSFSNEFVTTAARKPAGCTRSDEVLFTMRISSLKKEMFFFVLFLIVSTYLVTV